MSRWINMELLIILAILTLLSGCLHNPPIEKGEVPAMPEVKIKFDERLLTKCDTFEEKLVTGKDEEVVHWSEKALKNASDCRKAQHVLVDEVKKMLRMQ